MKKFILLLFFGLLAWPMAAIDAETKQRHSLELTVGDPFAISISQSFYTCGCGPEPVVTEYPDGSHTMVTPDYLGNIALPTFNFAYHYAAIPWLEVGVKLGYNYNGWGFRLQKITDMPGEERTIDDVPNSEGRMFHHNGYAMVSARFPYFRRPLVQLYSGIAAGVSVDYHSKDHAPIGTTITTVFPSYQLTALGARLGNDRVYGLLELGYGYQGFVNAGLGIRM